VLMLNEQQVRALTRKAKVTIDVAELYDALMKQSSADTVLASLLAQECPSKVGHCTWCLKPIIIRKGRNEMYVGHRAVNHEESCPWRGALLYAEVFLDHTMNGEADA
jgi:hypothetical protein